jgi:nitroreductase
VDPVGVGEEPELAKYSNVEEKFQVLNPVLAEDVRALTGRQTFVKDAPMNLIYVADLARLNGSSQEDKDLYSAADVGFISENVYLICASEGLVTVVRGSIDREALATVMKLRPDQKIILTQTVGYPKKP